MDITVKVRPSRVCEVKMSHDTILVVDFGAQYAQLIARRVREANVYSEIVPHTITAAEVSARQPLGLILSGGPKSVYAEQAPRLDPAIYELGIPILGICYGAQLIAQQMGGEVAKTGAGEYGRTELSMASPSLLFSMGKPQTTVWMSHNDAITRPPDGFRASGSTPNAPVAIMEDDHRLIYAVQFHPEVAHTPRGKELIRNFLTTICRCRGDWTPESFIDATVQQVRSRVGDRPVLCGLSGGVDSSVAAALVHKAVGDQLTCVYVDTGLMRAGETDEVERAFRDHFGIKLISVDAAGRFLSALDDIADPERKRRIIGELFWQEFWEHSLPLGSQFIVIGTLYPDHIESGTATAAKIKTHHNRVPFPDGVEFEVIEPLDQLFKDEVRLVGEQLGLPEEIVWRQPFPGPGLAIRVPGTITAERVDKVRAADAIVREEVVKAGLHRELWQYFAVLPEGRSVGVMGDERTYEHSVVLRLVTSDDAMTADWYYPPRELLENITSRIIGTVPGINRVALDVTSKPPGTIEWE